MSKLTTSGLLEFAALNHVDLPFHLRGKTVPWVVTSEDIEFTSTVLQQESAARTEIYNESLKEKKKAVSKYQTDLKNQRDPLTRTAGMLPPNHPVSALQDSASVTIQDEDHYETLLEEVKQEYTGVCLNSAADRSTAIELLARSVHGSYVSLDHSGARLNYYAGAGGGSRLSKDYHKQELATNGMYHKSSVRASSTGGSNVTRTQIGDVVYSFSAADNLAIHKFLERREDSLELRQMIFLTNPDTYLTADPAKLRNASSKSHSRESTRAKVRTALDIYEGKGVKQVTFLGNSDLDDILYGDITDYKSPGERVTYFNLRTKNFQVTEWSTLVKFVARAVITDIILKQSEESAKLQDSLPREIVINDLDGLVDAELKTLLGANLPVKNGKVLSQRDSAALGDDEVMAKIVDILSLHSDGHLSAKSLKNKLTITETQLKSIGKKVQRLGSEKSGLVFRSKLPKEGKGRPLTNVFLLPDSPLVLEEAREVVEKITDKISSSPDGLVQVTCSDADEIVARSEGRLSVKVHDSFTSKTEGGIESDLVGEVLRVFHRTGDVRAESYSATHKNMLESMHRIDEFECDTSDYVDVLEKHGCLENTHSAWMEYDDLLMQLSSDADISKESLMRFTIFIEVGKLFATKRAAANRERKDYGLSDADLDYVIATCMDHIDLEIIGVDEEVFTGSYLKNYIATVFPYEACVLRDKLYLKSFNTRVKLYDPTSKEYSNTHLDWTIPGYAEYFAGVEERDMERRLYKPLLAR